MIGNLAKSGNIMETSASESSLFSLALNILDIKSKRSGWFNQAKALNSEQKMLFTFNNPELKEGDIDVEEINFESDDDVCEEMENFSPVGYRKSNGRKSQKIIGFKL